MSEPRKTLPGWRLAGEAGAAARLGDCSALIPTCDRFPQVIRLLEGIAALPDQPAEVVIIDGAAVGDLGVRLREWHQGQRPVFDLVYARSERGLTRQRNAAVDLSAGEYLYFFDDDTVPQPGYFAEIRQVFENDRARRIGLIGGLIVNEIDRPIIPRWQWRLKLGLVPKDLPPGRYFDGATTLPLGMMKPFRGVMPVDFVSGCSSAWRRDVFRTMRFSEYFVGYSQGEDLEASLRAAREWQVVLCGDARILHLHAAGGRPVRFIRGKVDIINKYFIWKRHRPEVSLKNKMLFWLDVPFQFVTDIGAWLKRPWDPSPLIRTAGLACGAVECIVSPPRFEDPPVRRQYELAAGDGARADDAEPVQARQGR
ncbi:MAG: glycosyltransferase [Bryobacteraceae bacterium]